MARLFIVDGLLSSRWVPAGGVWEIIVARRGFQNNGDDGDGDPACGEMRHRRAIGRRH